MGHTPKTLNPTFPVMHLNSGFHFAAFVCSAHLRSLEVVLLTLAVFTFVKSNYGSNMDDVVAPSV